MKYVYILDADKPIKIVFEGPKITESEATERFMELIDKVANIPLINPATPDEIAQGIKKIEKE